MPKKTDPTPAITPVSPVSSHQITATINDTPGSYAGPIRVTDMSQTFLGGTVIYDEVIPFVLKGQPEVPGTAIPWTTKGGLQSRVTRASATGTYVFSYRVRDLEFHPDARTQVNRFFIELAELRNVPVSVLPIYHYNIAPNQSAGVHEWSPAPSFAFAGGLMRMAWGCDFTHRDGSTFVSLETTARKYTTGKNFYLNDQAFGSETLDSVAVPAP